MLCFYLQSIKLYLSHLHIYLPTFLLAVPVRNNLHLYRHYNRPPLLRLGSMYTHLTRPAGSNGGRANDHPARVLVEQWRGMGDEE